MGRLDIFRVIKRKRKTTKEVHACPLCLSLSIRPYRDSTSGWLSPQRYFCKDCGYFGPGYIILDEAELIKHVEDQTKTKDEAPQNETQV